MKKEAGEVRKKLQRLSKRLLAKNIKLGSQGNYCSALSLSSEAEWDRLVAECGHAFDEEAVALAVDDLSSMRARRAREFTVRSDSARIDFMTKRADATGDDVRAHVNHGDFVAALVLTRIPVQFTSADYAWMCRFTLPKGSCRIVS